MSESIMFLHLDRLQKIARYEITFKDILKDLPFDQQQFSCPETYAMTLEDLHLALHAMQSANPPLDKFGEDWLYPISQLEDFFHLNEILASAHDPDALPEEMKDYPGLRLLPAQQFSDIWWTLQNAWEDCPGELPLCDAVDFDTLIGDLERFLANQGKPLSEWQFAQFEMENYIRAFDNDPLPDWAGDPQLELARRMTEELCGIDSVTALRVKGYACYGGNALYPCDWVVSRDCMIRLFELTDDPFYADTLGYIYYYGRCTGGVPEYDEAFYYFGIAAANGLYEGMYKLADMFRHGYGCKQSLRTARSLYGMVYEDSLQNFLSGEHANFADAALRMGNVYAYGISEEVDPAAAYHYYLQADYAARLRLKNSSFFGHATVVKNTEKALEETRKKLPEDYFRPYAEHELPFQFKFLADDNHPCSIVKETLADGHVQLTARRLSTRSVPHPRSILLTIPEINLCERTREISYVLDEDAQVWFGNGDDSLYYDYCCWNELESRYDFFLVGDLVAWTKSEAYRIYGRPENSVE